MTFENPFVRHLYWAVSTSHLAYIDGVEALAPPEDDLLRQWCLTLDKMPEQFQTFLSTHEHRLLGSYFEVIWQFFCGHYPGWKCLGSRIQIPTKGPTIGELDLICLPPDGLARHAELAVKFYLRHPNKSGQAASHWLGPRTNDRLDLKLNKLTEKQFSVVKHPETQMTLKEQNLPLDPQPCSIIKGYLFDPLDNPTECWPQHVSPPKNTGTWITSNQIQLIADKHENWCVIDKHNWLGPFQQRASAITLPPSSLIQFVHSHFAKPNYALMLIALNHQDNTWQEHSRFMVVMDGWPNV